MTIRVTEPRTRHWTLAEYYRLAEEGYFQGQHVQLVEGEIINLPPQGHAHCQSLLLLSRWLQKAFGPEYVIRTQMPLNASYDSDPEPDIAIVRGPSKSIGIIRGRRNWLSRLPIRACGWTVAKLPFTPPPA
ncbi:MAG TPA: Uma2 family endonuclease [Tepidisphaeraceae bacterium]|jgi:Uma2 family endonuclease|nr:Uma2 family endonuclease [Tepidisphaeraceae bacterium]